ncbi:hypothetical protein C436_18441 [Haloarcula marismortui ATCC 33800]|uniref:DUF7389 domain-containing protein n=1 Tax=Haloarcula marismortui ATCC 33800 TaxID=662476 RepID=M0JQV9_9EURY|nr:hypothetical protein C436_18441 [Haloarcula sinaiiensis ATCC 33800]
MEARMKRGTGTRDEDSMTIKSKGETAAETISEFYQLWRSTSRKSAIGFGMFSQGKTRQASKTTSRTLHYTAQRLGGCDPDGGAHILLISARQWLNAYIRG